jgi:competence protein ComEA
MDNKLKKFLAIFIVLVFALSSYIYHFYFENSIEIEDNDSLAFEMKEKVENSTSFSEKKIIVHLSGAVAKAGVYQISQDDRLIDLIKAAGGLNDNADLKNVNLAAALLDGQKIIIPSENNIKEDAEFVEQKVEDYYINTQSGLVNINRADLNQLTKLNGIGQSKAQAIIKYREKNGLFKNKESLINVSGIGEKTLENIRDEISIK